MREQYLKQVRLMLETIPHIMREKEFAIKGGTAINFFVREIPRLSVDIDLTYLPIKGRKESLQAIDSALERCKERLLTHLPECSIQEKRAEGYVITLWISQGGAVVKLEVNTTLRGSVFPSEDRDVSSALQNNLKIDRFVTARVLSVADLYGGKLVAALDRQHPRDFFDVMTLFENEGISKEIRQALVVYISSSNRPIHELVAPNRSDMKPAFENEFEGMTVKSVTLKSLEAARDRLFETIPKILNQDERRFLMSIKLGEPQWELLPLKNIENLPGIQWKLANIRKMEKSRHSEAVERLRAALEL